jgi:hypothetical protein
MATSPANPAEIQDRTKKDHGKPIRAKDKPEEGGWGGGEQGSRGDADRQAEEAGNK